MEPGSGSVNLMFRHSSSLFLCQPQASYSFPADMKNRLLLERVAVAVASGLPIGSFELLARWVLETDRCCVPRDVASGWCVRDQPPSCRFGKSDCTVGLLSLKLSSRGMQRRIYV